MSHMKIEDIQALMKSVADNRLGELCVELEGVKIKIKNQMAAAPAVVQTAAPAVISAFVQEAPAAAPAPAEGRYITSPIVGTFYASASPDKDPFVAVGQTVNAGDVAFIIESMKVMNEVPADQNGVVAEILVENGQAVEYGQKILRLE